MLFCHTFVGGRGQGGQIVVLTTGMFFGSNLAFWTFTQFQIFPIDICTILSTLFLIYELSVSPLKAVVYCSDGSDSDSFTGQQSTVKASSKA